MAESFFIFYALSVDFGGGVILDGGDFLGGGVILGGGDDLSGEIIFYFLCFISRFGWQRHFGWRRLFG